MSNYYSFALEQCIKQGVTRDPQFGQGNGLYGTFEMAALSGGTFHINSGKAHLVYTRGSQIQVRDDKLPICGTSVVCAINFGVATLLERALAFKGTGYQMVDHIELQYESREDQATFFLKSEAQSRGSRKSGLEVRRKLSNLLSVSDANVVIDMNDIGLMSSSFADEVFGKLALALGIETFRARVTIANSSDTNRSLISKAIAQRLQILTLD